MDLEQIRERSDTVIYFKPLAPNGVESLLLDVEPGDVLDNHVHPETEQLKPIEVTATGRDTDSGESWIAGNFLEKKLTKKT